MEKRANAEFALSVANLYDANVQQHKLFREQEITALLTINGLALPLLLNVPDETLRVTGATFAILVTLIIGFLGEKNLGMVIHYQHLWQRIAKEHWPDVFRAFESRESDIMGALMGEIDVDGVERLRGIVGIAYRISFRTIWRWFVGVVVLLDVSVGFRLLP